MDKKVGSGSGKKTYADYTFGGNPALARGRIAEAIGKDSLLLTGTTDLEFRHGRLTGAGNTVTFEPGARTAWHTHPLGQTLIVTAGCGRAQREGGPIEEIRPGDVVWFPPGEKHWHGAAPKTAMTHIAIQEALDGKAVDWLERVSEAQYRK